MGRTTSGRLFKRGKKKHFYVQYYLNGKEIRKALHDKDGNPIYSRKEAEKARDILLSPYATADEQQRREQAYSALKTAEEKALEAEKINRQAIPLKGGWNIYEKSRFRPDSGPATLINYKRHYNKFLNWMTQRHPDKENIAEVSAAIASEYAFFLDREGFSRNTYNKHISFLKLFYKVMIEDEHTEINPFGRLKCKKLNTNSRKELSVEQIFNLLSKATGELALLLGLGYFTGLRRGDCCTLQWSEVDLIRRIITRIPNKIKDRSSNPDAVKIGICNHLYNALSQIPTDKRTGYVLPEMADFYLNSKRDRINRMIKRHFEACGIKTIKENTGEGTKTRAVIQYGFHSLRYSYISHHAEAGTPQAVIQANAGHANPAMTEHYTRISDEMALRVAGALDVAEKPQGANTKNLSSQELSEIRALIDSLTADTWENVKKILQEKFLS